MLDPFQIPPYLTFEVVNLFYIYNKKHKELSAYVKPVRNKGGYLHFN